MKCPFCVEAGQISKVVPGIKMTTSMMGRSYYDEEGEYHSHDPNWHTTSYRCSNGHAWSSKYKLGCRVAGCEYKSTPLTIEPES
jgi:hypothetical protein